MTSEASPPSVTAQSVYAELHADEGSISLHAKEEVRISGSELLGAVEGVQLARMAPACAAPAVRWVRGATPRRAAPS